MPSAAATPTEIGSPANAERSAATAPSVDAIAATTPTLPERTAVYSKSRPTMLPAPATKSHAASTPVGRDAAIDDERHHDHEPDGHDPGQRGEGTHVAARPRRAEHGHASSTARRRSRRGWPSSAATRRPAGAVRVRPRPGPRVRPRSRRPVAGSKKWNRAASMDSVIGLPGRARGPRVDACAEPRERLLVRQQRHVVRAALVRRGLIVSSVRTGGASTVKITLTSEPSSSVTSAITSIVGQARRCATRPRPPGRRGGCRGSRSCPRTRAGRVPGRERDVEPGERRRGPPTPAPRRGSSAASR